MTRSTRDILVAARARIDDPEKWCQGAYGIDAEGVGIDFMSIEGERSIPLAVRACAVGAIYVEVSGHTQEGSADARKALRDASIHLYGLPANIVNDTLGHDAVMKVYDIAIERAS